jgi:hypothetical protein
MRSICFRKNFGVPGIFRASSIDPAARENNEKAVCIQYETPRVNPSMGNGPFVLIHTDEYLRCRKGSVSAEKSVDAEIRSINAMTHRFRRG